MRLSPKVAVLALIAAIAPFNLRAQSIATTSPAVTSTPAAPAAPGVVTPGPTIAAASVAYRPAPADSTDMTTQRRTSSRGLGQARAMMIAGGAAVILGIVIGGDGGTLIAVGGGAVGLYGLYLYMK